MEYTFGTIADIPALIDMRTAYILEDFGELSPEDEAIMRKTLPDYFSEHLNRDCIAFLAKDGETVVSVALLMILQKPCHPKMIHGKMGEVLRCIRCLLIADRALHSTICNGWLIMREPTGWIM